MLGWQPIKLRSQTVFAEGRHRRKQAQAIEHLPAPQPGALRILESPSRTRKGVKRIREVNVVR
jgi:hypothetical protein